MKFDEDISLPEESAASSWAGLQVFLDLIFGPFVNKVPDPCWLMPKVRVIAKRRREAEGDFRLVCRDAALRVVT
jgi:hypothetical protein